MSSLVVRLLEVRYVWNPARPMIDQTLKKQMTQTMILAGECLTASRKFACKRNNNKSRSRDD